MAALLCYVAFRLLPCRRVVALAAIGTWTAVECTLVLLQWGGYAESNHLLFPITGTFRNPGPLGGYLAVGITALAGIAQLLISRHRKAAAAIIAAMLCMVALVLAVSDSRAAWLAAAAGIGYLTITNTSRLAAIRFTTARKCIAATAVAAIIVALYLHKPQSANGRLLIWRVTADMIADSPITGHGSGSYAEEYLYYQARYFARHPSSPLADRAGVVNRPFNELLRAWSEGGIIAVAIALALLGCIDWKTKDTASRTVNAAIAAMATFAMFSYPSYVVHFQVTFAALLACAPHKRQLLSPATRSHRRTKAIIGIAAAMACTVTLCHIQRRTADAHDALQRLFETGDTSGIAQCSDVIANNATQLSALATYSATHLPHDQRAKILTLAATKAPTPDLLCDLAAVYAEEGDYDRAKLTLQTAQHSIPQMIRPRYELCKLMLATGDTVQARQIVKTLLDSNIPIESSAALQMLGEMTRHLNN